MTRLILSICIFSFAANAQEIIYYDKLNKKTSKDSAQYYRTIKKNNEIDYEVIDYFMSGTKKMEGHFRYMEPEYKQGKFIYYYENGNIEANRNFFSAEHGTSTYYYQNGKIKLIRKYLDGIEIDTLRSYYETGELKRIQYFKDQKKEIVGKVFTKTGIDTTFYPYEEYAIYKCTKEELNDFSYKHLIYPKQAKHDGFKGFVRVQCIVTENGTLEVAKVLNTTHDFLVPNALDFVKKIPAWKPSKLDGIPFRSYYILSIHFNFR